MPSSVLRRYTKLWEHCIKGDIPPGQLQKLQDILWSKYNEEHRYYHTLSHIEQCLQEFDLARPYLKQPDEVEMALWFHDIIYDVRSDDNEQRSAALFSLLGKELFTGSFIRSVAHLIITTTFDARPRKGDERYIADIDISYMGLNYATFRENSEDIKTEYIHIAPEEYDERMVNIFTGILERPKIYLTDFFHDKFEKQARKNISKYIKETKNKDFDI